MSNGRTPDAPCSVHDFINGFGAGNGTSLNDAKHDNPAVLLPEIHFFTNDSWPIIRGVASAKGFPVDADEPLFQRESIYLADDPGQYRRSL